MEEDIVDRLLVSTFRIEPWVWDGDREAFEEALKKELAAGMEDLRIFAMDAYDKRKNALAS